MVVSGGTTLLALAGVVTAAVLIFTASLAVLWPVLIGCACAAAVGAIIFMVVRCASAKNARENGKEGEEKGNAISVCDGKLDIQKSEKNDGRSSANSVDPISSLIESTTDFVFKGENKTIRSPSEEIEEEKEHIQFTGSQKYGPPSIESQFIESRDDMQLVNISQSKENMNNTPNHVPVLEVLAPELAQVQPQATQDTTTKFAYALDVMKDDVTISDALTTLAADNGVQLSENDRDEICRLVHDVRSRSGKEADTLGDLRQERSGFFDLNNAGYNISNDALPFLFPILALLTDSESCLERNENSTLSAYIVSHGIIPIHYHQISTYSIFNHSNHEYFKRSFLCDESKNIANKYIFAVHYEGENMERHLVIDYPAQTTDMLPSIPNNPEEADRDGELEEEGKAEEAEDTKLDPDAFIY
jgi:hypothetical protein